MNEKPWLTNDQLSDSLKPFCEPGKKPPKREALRQFLIKNGIIRVELKKKPLISDIKKEKNRICEKIYRKRSGISGQHCLERKAYEIV